MYKLTVVSLFLWVLTLSYAQTQRNRFTEYLLRSKKFDPFGNLPKSQFYSDPFGNLPEPQFYSKNEQDESSFSMPDAVHAPLNFIAPPYPISSRMSSPRNKVPLPPAMFAMSTISLPKLTPIMKMAVIRGIFQAMMEMHLCGSLGYANYQCMAFAFGLYDPLI
ncbi:uncharacterized protein LOC127832448 [Dreissena polymorpha]|uniref:Uncharacterized protein n=1 Tax=Dreissena polymorpha TaxID=45954 RepID=A0A9D4H8G0_DREPO|nr:uncharacterized protein LOC127832448 [Dreissena polymorpha]KAH3828896.1 hypothetical protein DPMN_130881 [Dreissena polymorpha]